MKYGAAESGSDGAVSRNGRAPSGTAGRLIVHEPGDRHARVDDQRRYSLPSSISF